jgi:hypothetical protein
MFNPLSLITPLVNPRAWACLGQDVLRATPVLIPVYGIFLQVIVSVTTVRPNADPARLELLRQLMALDLTMLVFAFYQLGRWLRR